MPDAYGNPTEAELRGQTALDPSILQALYALPTPTAAQLAARSAAAPARNNAANAPAFQPANPNDPFYQRSDIAPLMQATNRDVLGGGAYGYRNWMRSHPLGTIAAFGALAYGGAAAAGAGVAGGAGAGAGSSGLAAGGGALSSDAALGAAADAGVGTFGAGAAGAGLGAGAAAGALPEIVVTGQAGGAGLTAAQAGALSGAGGAATSLYHGPVNGSYGENGGLNTNSDPLGTFQQGIGTGSNAGDLAASGGIQGGAGMGTAAGTANSSWLDYLGPLISAGSSLVGSHQASGAIKDATAASVAEQQRQFDLVRGDTAPARALGTAAIGTLGDLYGYGTGTPDMSKFFTSPDYQFNLAEGQKAIDRSAASRGGLLSGGAVKAGEQYASGLASREYSGYVDRLLQQAGLGNTGIAASAASGANAANNISNATVNSGNSRASIYENNAANINNSAQSGLSTYILNRYLNG